MRSDTQQRIDRLFNPRSIAFVGASSHLLKWGFRILLNLMEGGFRGKVYPVNPHEKEILGLSVYPSVNQLPEIPDLVLIVIPPVSVPQAVEECATAGIKAGVVITAGFSEVGERGKEMEAEAVRIARRRGMVLVGPNCNGIMTPSLHLYPVMPPVFPCHGSLGLVTQGGNVGTSIVKRAIFYGIGFSKYVSTGNEADLHNEDFIEYLAGDPETKVIMTYVEGFKDARRFFAVAKEATRRKPVIALKGGTTGAGAKAARSHTGSMAGSDAIFSALCRQTGVIRVKDIDELFQVAAGFAKQPLPEGRRVGIVTGGGSWGVLASDACSRVGLDVVSLPPDTLEELDSFLPSWWSHGNPVDLVAGLNESDIQRSVEALLRCPQVDGVILLLGIRHLWRLGSTLGETTPGSPYARWYETIANRVRGGEEGEPIIATIRKLMARYGKPVILAEERIEESEGSNSFVISGLEDRAMVSPPSPDLAALVMSSMAQYAEYLREN